jgi:hypothetical protein
MATPYGLGVAMQTGRRLSLFLLGGREKAMLHPRAIEVGPHDLAVRVDSAGSGEGFVATFHLQDFPLSSPLTMRWWRSGRMNFKGSQFEKEIVLWGVRWYVAYPISYRQLEETMRERGVAVDHSTLNRWVRKYAPEVAARRDVCKNQREIGLPLSRRR